MKLRSLVCLVVSAVSLLVACVPGSTPARPVTSSATPLETVVGVDATAVPATATRKAPGRATATGSTADQLSPTAEGEENPLDFIAAEMTGRPTATSVTVNVVPAVSMELYYEYGLAPGVYLSRTVPQSAAAGLPLETLLEGLLPNTRYYFRLRYGSAAVPERTFVTQRAPGSTFVFDLQGDSHPERTGRQFDATLYQRTLLSAAADRPDFYFTLGDDFSVDALKSVTADTVRSLYIAQRQWLEWIGAPVFLVNGNHEQAALANLDGTPDNVAVWAQVARNAYFPEPAPDSFYSGNDVPLEYIGLLRNYYAFTWGDALFVVIDPYWHSPLAVDNQFGAGHEAKGQRDLWNNTLGDVQYQWFRQTLETSSARYKFVLAHHVNGTGRGGVELADTFEWGDAAGLATHRPGWDKTLHQIMVDTHVTIFFQGHDHIFVRQQLDGVVYQTLPEPANPHYTLENATAYTSGDPYPNSGHVRVTVSPDGVQVDYVRSYLDQADEVAFSYTVK